MLRDNWLLLAIITELFSLKRAFKRIRSNLQPNATIPIKPHPTVPCAHISWTPPGPPTPPPPGQPILMSDQGHWNRQGKFWQIALQHLFIFKSIFMLKLSPNLISYEWLQQMICIIVFKNEWYVSNENHMLLNGFSCHFWGENQPPDLFFPSTCWITSYANNLQMKTMKYCMMETCKGTSVLV